MKLLGPGEYVLERRLGDRREGGHFGLGVADYVHSTAPNRRFVDLVTQRLLKATERATAMPYAEDELHEIARRCTEREREAKKVERAMRKRIAAHFLRDRVGESFVATVTGKSSKGMWVRVLSPPVEGHLARGAERADVGDTMRVRLTRADAVRGLIDFEPETVARDLPHKIERQRRKRRAADALRSRLGERFDATVTGVSRHGVWARLHEMLPDGTPIEGKIVAGYKALLDATGKRVTLTLVGVNTALGFIDFEFAEGVDLRKRERLERKRAAARELGARVGERFEVEVTGVTPKAVWVRTVDSGAEGRLVRGFAGVANGDRVSAVLLEADAERGISTSLESQLCRATRRNSWSTEDTSVSSVLQPLNLVARLAANTHRPIRSRLPKQPRMEHARKRLHPVHDPGPRPTRQRIRVERPRDSFARPRPSRGTQRTQSLTSRAPQVVAARREDQHLRRGARHLGHADAARMRARRRQGVHSAGAVHHSRAPSGPR